MICKTLIMLMLMITMMLTIILTECLKLNNTIILEWVMMKTLNLTMKIEFIVDFKALMFSSTVMMITTSVIWYSKFYMKHNKNMNSFIKLIVMFIMSMMVLIFSINMISMLMGWEALGMTSFILIMFYKNKKSLTSSFYTMMMNRVGDISLIISMMYMMNTNSWSVMTAMIYNNNMLMMILMVIAMFSKSAQIPFSSWLTEAMAAPTPISALVHSSTLVTAGVFMMIRFEMSMMVHKTMEIMLLMSMLTILMAGINSTTELDIKKVIALSTLMQLSIMFISIQIKMFNMAMFHLILHATFKALIFLCASSFINWFNTQDLRLISFTPNMFYTITSFNFANMSMCGLPMMSGFYSKELIMELSESKISSMLFMLMFIMSITLSIYYSIKMMVFVNLNINKTFMIKTNETMEQKSSSTILILPSSIMGNKINWTINMMHDIPYISMTQKMLPIIMMMVIMMFLKEKMMKSNKFNSFKTNNNMMYINFMMYSKTLNLQFKNMFLTTCMLTFMETEKSMKEKMLMEINKMINKITKKEFYLQILNNKTIIMIIIMILVSLMM